MKKVLIIMLSTIFFLLICGFGKKSHSDEFVDKFGKTYYYDLAGNIVKDDFVKKDGNYYHFDKKGAMTKGWYIENNKTYYFDNNGKMVTGKYKINNSIHFFDIDGSIKEGWVSDGSKYYYCKENGKIVTKTWIDANNNITNNVEQGVYYLDDEGEMAQNCCREYNNSLYAFDSNGQKFRGVRVANILFNDGYGVNNEATLKRSGSVMCHFHICSGGEKKEETINYKVTYPNGQTSVESMGKMETDRAYYIGWENGIGNFPAGTLRIQFYDSNNNLIGEGSVYITV